MTPQEVNSIVLFVNKIIASNNPTVAVATLKKYGYQTPYNVLSADQIEKALLELYVANPRSYIQAIKEIVYRPEITNWTTSPQTKDKIKQLATNLGVLSGSETSRFDFGEIWNGIKGVLGDSITTTTGSSTTSSQAAVNPWIVALVTIATIAALFLVYKST